MTTKELLKECEAQYQRVLQAIEANMAELETLQKQLRFYDDIESRLKQLIH